MSPLIYIPLGFFLIAILILLPICLYLFGRKLNPKPLSEENERKLRDDHTGITAFITELPTALTRLVAILRNDGKSLLCVMTPEDMADSRVKDVCGIYKAPVPESLKGLEKVPCKKLSMAQQIELTSEISKTRGDVLIADNLFKGLSDGDIEQYIEYLKWEQHRKKVYYFATSKAALYGLPAKVIHLR